MRTTESEQSQKQEQKPGRKRSGKAAHRAEQAAPAEAAAKKEKKRKRKFSPKSLHGKVLGLITDAYESLESKKNNLSLSDLARLVQLEKELRPQSYERMVVEWVDRKQEGE